MVKIQSLLLRIWWHWAAAFFEFLIGFTLAVVISIMSGENWFIACYTGFVSGSLLFILLELIKVRVSQSRFFDTYIGSDTESFLRYFHGIQDIKHFRAAVEAFDRLGGTRYIISEFIRLKMKTDFSSISDISIRNMSSHDYIKLLCRLIEIAKSSVYMTCPFTPSEWFKIVNLSKVDLKTCPEYLRFFLLNHRLERLRLLNYRRERYNTVKTEEIDKLIEFTAPIREAKRKHRTVKEKRLEQYIINLDDYDFTNNEINMWSEDYTVLDNSIVLVWQRNGTGPQKGDCRLIFNENDIEGYAKPFEFIEKGDCRFLTTEEFIEENKNKAS